MAIYSVKDNGSLSMNKSDDLCIHFLESLYDCAQRELLPVRIDAYPYNDKDILRYEAIITNRDTEEEIADYLVSVYPDGIMDIIDMDVLSDRYDKKGYDYRCHEDYQDAYVCSCDTESKSDYDDMVNNACGVIMEFLDEVLYDIDVSAYLNDDLGGAEEDVSCRSYAYEDMVSNGITQCPSYVPTQPIMSYGWLAGHTEDVPTIPDKTDKSSMDAIRKRNKKRAGKSELEQRKTLLNGNKGISRHRSYEAEEDDDKGMYYRFYSLLYAERHLSELLKYPDVENNVHDFEIFTYSPSGVKTALQEKMFLKKQDYAVINRIRSGFSDVIVGYLVPESVKDTNTWEYAEISVGMNQDIKVTWRH